MKAMRVLPKAKTPGASGLRNELLISGTVPLARAISLLFTACWKLGRVPREWNVALIHPVPKKGDMSLISNYRPISLTETLRKLFERCLLPYLTDLLEPLDISQGGFRSKRSTIDQIASLHEAILQRSKTLGRRPLVAYLDIKAAYDTVDTSKLWSILARRGLYGEQLEILRMLFDSNNSQVVMRGSKSIVLHTRLGYFKDQFLAQSCMHASSMISHADYERIRLLPWGTPAASFFYADDIAIIADDSLQLERMLEECE